MQDNPKKIQESDPRPNLDKTPPLEIYNNKIKIGERRRQSTKTPSFSFSFVFFYFIY